MKTKVSPEFRNILLQLTNEYLVEAPDDFIEFAIEFFTRMKVTRISRIMTKDEIGSYDLSEMDYDSDDAGKRLTIFQGSVNIEDDISHDIIPKESSVMKQLKDELQNILIFSSLREEDLDHLVDLMARRKVNENEIIVQEGDDGDYFYVVGEGRFCAYKVKGNETVILDTYVDSGYFGEIALLYDVPRSCSVKAETDGVLWYLNRPTFRHTVLTAAADRRRRSVDFLSKVPMLNNLSDEEKHDLADCLELQIYPPSSRIIKEGDQANGMYFIIKGTVKVTVQRAGRSADLEVKRMNEGEYFGELALLTRKPRAASVFAHTEVHVAFLETQSFERLLGPCIELMKRSITNYREEIDALHDL